MILDLYPTTWMFPVSLAQN